MSSGLQAVPSRLICRSSNRRAFTWRSISRRQHCSVFLCRMCSLLGPTRCANEAARLHHAARRRGGSVAARGARAAVGKTADYRIFGRQHAFVREPAHRRLCRPTARTRLDRGPHHRYRGPYAPSRERPRFGSEFISALRRDFQQGGPAAIAKVRKYQPAAYMKICALVIPKEMKVEHSDGIKAMTDEQLDEALEVLRQLIADRAAAAANVIEGTAEPVALPAPGQSLEATPEPKQKHESNRLMREADTAVGPRERKPSRR